MIFNYRIQYKHENQTITREFKTKKQAIKYYIELLETPAETDITELTIYKGEKDITISINKFLFN